MNKRVLLLILPIIFLGSVHATEYLVIRSVDSWWSNGPGMIDSASVLVEPKGIYAQCTLILEFAASGDQFISNDSLEADMNFKLPDGSEITDLVLWIDDEPIQGRWYDRWTASLIYESIVQRRIDPAILTKVGANEYNIKIFPLLTTLQRKIKIQYLTPINNIKTSNPSVSLPLNILKLSSSLPAVFEIAYKPTEQYSGAFVREDQTLIFSPEEHIEFGSCKSVQMGNLDEPASLNLVFTPEEQKDIDLMIYTDPETTDNYYQLAVRHRNIFGPVQKRKALFMVDFIDENCSAYDKTDILNSLEFSIRNSFSPRDSFNVIFSGMVTNFPEEKWIAADSAGINGFFNSLDVSLFNSYSNLPTLLIDGIEFVKDRGSEGSLVLVSSSNSNGENIPANSLITDFIQTLEGTDIPIHIIDLDDQNYPYYEQHYIGGQYYRGNEYFYTRLSQLTVGEYYSVQTRSLNSMLEQVNHRISGYFKSLEVFIKTEGGYTYSNYKLNNNGGLVYNDEAFCMTGLYLGSAPFIVNLYGQSSQGQVFQISDTLSGNLVQVGDSTLRAVWAAQKIRELLGQERSNQLLNQIITTSLDEHVLTDYTAILVLEPGTQIPDDDETGEDNLIPTYLEPDRKEDGFNLEVYPNPITEASMVSFEVSLKADVQLIIYDARGQMVNTLIDETLAAGEYQTPLKAENLEKGVYFCILFVDGRIMARSKVVVV